MSATGSAPKAHSLAIAGMTCVACAGHVERALNALPGITSTHVNLAAERADIIVSDPAVLAKIPGVIADAGYAVPEEASDIAIEGMFCASCTNHVERALLALPGVISASVNLATSRAHVIHHAGIPGEAAIENAVVEAGYAARIVAVTAPGAGQSARRHKEELALRRDILVAGSLAVPLLLLEMTGHIVPAFHHWLHGLIEPTQLRWVQAALASAIVFGPGLRFHKSGLPGLLAMRPDMNALVSLGTLSAWGYSMAVTVAPGAFPEANRAIYFESAGVIILFVMIGRWLESRSRGAAGQAIERLVALAPQEAHVLRDGAFTLAPAGDIIAGDRIELRPGDRVPVDGVIVEGRSHLDESMLTGEPMPVDKTLGQGVTGGTINLEGRLLIEATRVGRDATLARIIRLVENAQAGKLPIQSRIDRVTAIFVPAVLGIAVLTFALWMVFSPAPAFQPALIHAVAVLIIACPCAMGLATPMSILVGTGRAAELGLLFRDGAALQRLAEVDRIAFDKTGTLTLGKPTLTDFHVASGLSRKETLAAIAAVEAQSEHPIARAVVTFAEGEGVGIAPASDARAEIGRGFSGRVAGREVLVGSAGWLGERGIALEALAKEDAALTASGKGAIYAAIDGKLAAIMAISDPVRSESAALIRDLRGLGVATLLISGDAGAAADRLAQEVGIADAIGEATPQRKATIIADLRAKGETIAFVGDGINDAAALGAADIGIAIGTGTEVAIESADVVLVSARLGAVAEAIALARATMRNIGQNLFWAFGYNAVLIPVAAGALAPAFGWSLSPALAAVAMAMSSVFVVTNALRLRRFGRTS